MVRDRRFPAQRVKPFAEALVRLKKRQTKAAPSLIDVDRHIIRLGDGCPLRHASHCREIPGVNTPPGCCGAEEWVEATIFPACISPKGLMQAGSGQKT